jgi:hypothetical protein
MPGIRLTQPASVARLVIGLIRSLLVELYEHDNLLPDSFHVVETVLILLAGGLAVMGNRAGFRLIEQAGAITFQVFGHVAILVPFDLWYLFHAEEIRSAAEFAKTLCGFGMSVIGVTWYTLFEMNTHDLKVQVTVGLQEPGLDDLGTSSLLVEAPYIAIENANAEEEL